MNFEPIPFIPGLDLSAAFYHQAVGPLLNAHFPQLSHSAARLDYGSDVLGFDTPQSRDHGWGPKVTLFLSPADCDCHKEEIYLLMSERLPVEVCGYPTNYDEPFTAEASLVPVECGPVNPWVEVTTVQDFCTRYLGFDPTSELDIQAWLKIPQQNLRTIASGRVFHDGLGELNEVRERLSWYPHDLWLYLLANQWRRIDQEEPFMARCGDAGDEIGSRLVAARMIDEVMRLCFLMERRYRPYYKWFGSAFQRLSCAETLTPVFHQVLNSRSWSERETHLSTVYRVVMHMHNALCLTPEIKVEISPFYNRPYQVPHTARFVDAFHAAIQSKEVRALPRDIGALDQFVNSTDILTNRTFCRKLHNIYK